MAIQSGSLQTPVTDFNVPGILDGQVTGMDVLDPTENNEKTALLYTDLVPLAIFTLVLALLATRSFHKRLT